MEIKVTQEFAEMIIKKITDLTKELESVRTLKDSYCKDFLEAINKTHELENRIEELEQENAKLNEELEGKF